MNDENLANGKKTQINGEIAASYQVKSAASRKRNNKRNKSIAQIISTIEKLPLNEVGKSYLKRGGLDLTDVDPEDLTMMDGAVAGVFLAALKGNPKAFDQLVRFKAQQQKDKLEIEKLKAEVKTLKAMLEPPENKQDDGFIAALADNSDWEDYEQEAADAEDQSDAADDGSPV